MSFKTKENQSRLEELELKVVFLVVFSLHTAAGMLVEGEGGLLGQTFNIPSRMRRQNYQRNYF